MNTNTKGEKLKNVLGWIAPFLIAVLIVAILFLFVHPGVVSGPSMLPNYHSADRFFIIKDWCVTEYDYEDVVCVEIAGSMLIQRIIGLPGDLIEFKDGAVYRNGEKLDESAYLPTGTQTTVASNRPAVYELGDDEYFVLGDNRQVSRDSRSFGEVSSIMGKTWFFFRSTWFHGSEDSN